MRDFLATTHTLRTVTKTNDAICVDGSIFTTPGQFRRVSNHLVYEFRPDGFVRVLGQAPCEIPWAELGFPSPEVTSVWGDGIQYFVCVNGMIVKNDGEHWERVSDDTNVFYELGGNQEHLFALGRHYSCCYVRRFDGTLWKIIKSPETAFFRIHNLDGRLIFSNPNHLYKFTEDLRCLLDFNFLYYYSDLFLRNGVLNFVGLRMSYQEEHLAIWSEEEGWSYFALPQKKMASPRAISCDGTDMVLLLDDEMYSLKLEDLLNE